MANDISVLEGKIGELEAVASETNATLGGLAAEVVRLKDVVASLPPDIQPQIDALVARAQAVIDGQRAAEDSADDALPAA